jgi:DNA-binding beta-propeller fold protein YncE
LYVGKDGVASDGMSAGTELRVLDAATRNRLARVQTSVPFWSVTVSQDSKQIYAVVPKHHRVLVIDAITLQEKRAIGIGNTPSLAIIAP